MNEGGGVLVDSHQDEPVLLDFIDDFTADFGRINRQWIEKVFKMEPADIWALEHPQEIIKQGGYIVMCRLGDRMVGTGALMVSETAKGVMEIVKMGVDEDCRGKGIGDKIMKHLINHARQRKDPVIHTLKIETSHLLPGAIHLYKKNGFVDDTCTVSYHGYERADVFLTMPLV